MNESDQACSAVLSFAGSTRRLQSRDINLECSMSGIRIIAFVLIVAGALALAYGGFTYTKDTHTANLGPLSLSVKEKERVNIPMWAGLVAVIIGGVVLVSAGRKA
jgi:hypothetical protein